MLPDAPAQRAIDSYFAVDTGDDVHRPTADVSANGVERRPATRRSYATSPADVDVDALRPRPGTMKTTAMTESVDLFLNYLFTYLLYFNTMSTDIVIGICLCFIF